jgi:putative transferase (TIGR04331 family)
MKYHLQVLRDINTDYKKKPILYLDKWAVPLDILFSKNDINVMPSYLENRNEEDLSYSKLTILESKIMQKLCDSLNAIHGVNYSIRFWYILLGQWVRRFTRYVYNRYHSLKCCFNVYEISSVGLYDIDVQDVLTKDYNHFMCEINQDELSSYVIDKIIRYKNKEKIIMYGDKECLSVQNELKLQQSMSNRTKWKIRIAELISLFANKLNSNSAPVITSTYMTRVNEALLQVLFGNFPLLYINTEYSPELDMNASLREMLKHKLYSGFSVGFESFVMAIIPELIPKIYLEGFNDLIKRSKQLPLPSNPKFIFTSNRYISDEVFMAWTGLKIDLGAYYFLIQHGNVSGESKNHNPSIEELVCDKYLTWGWCHNRHKHVRSFVSNGKVSSLPKSVNKRGCLLLIERGCIGRERIEDVSERYINYLDSKAIFYGGVKKEIKSKIIIRMHIIMYLIPLFDERNRWFEVNNAIQFDSPNNSVGDSIKNSKLVVYFYQSTGILESISANMPFLAYLDDFDSLTVEAKRAYQIMIDVGVFYIDVKQLALKVNDVWDNTDKWWGSLEVQRARKYFSRLLARSEKSPVLRLKNVLSDQCGLISKNNN